jgi:hypothetical protein
MLNHIRTLLAVTAAVAETLTNLKYLMWLSPQEDIAE